MREIKYPNGFVARLSERWFRSEEEQAAYETKFKEVTKDAPRTSYKEFSDYIDKKMNG